MKEFKGDKRTREYKEWKANFDNQSKGLGDTVEKITEATGIKKAVKAVFGDDCGCDERKEKWNKDFSYKVYECLTEKEFNYIKEWIDSGKNRLNNLQLIKMNKIYNRVFNQTFKCQKCSANIMMKKLIKLFNKY